MRRYKKLVIPGLATWRFWYNWPEVQPGHWEFKEKKKALHSILIYTHTWESLSCALSPQHWTLPPSLLPFQPWSAQQTLWLSRHPATNHEVGIVIPFYRWRNRDPERLSDFAQGHTSNSWQTGSLGSKWFPVLQAALITWECSPMKLFIHQRI